MKSTLSWPMSGKKRRVSETDSITRLPLTNDRLQDFVAAEKKAYAVGAKKFFLAVRRSNGCMHAMSNRVA